MTTYLIIDGYNLMHAAGIARQSYGRGDMERCRERLNRELAGLLSPDILQQAVIVYDAFASLSDDNRRQIVNGLMVLYAPKGTDADTEIERLLQQHSVPRRILVVSSDHRLHKSAGRRRARCVDSEDFWTSLTSESDSNTQNQSPEPMKPKLPSEERIDDLQRWADSTTAADVEIKVDVSSQTAPEQPVAQQSAEPTLPSAPRKKPIDNLQRWADLAAEEFQDEVDSAPAPTAPESPSTAEPDPLDALQRWADSTSAAAEKEAEKAIMGNSIFDEDYLRQIDKEIEEDELN